MKRLLPRLVVALVLCACSRGEKAGEQDAGDDAAATSAEVVEPISGASPEEPPMLLVFAPVAPVLTVTEFPPRDPSRASDERQGAGRLGYLRRGAKVPLKRGRIAKKNCAEGWYELATGGFVCGKYATLDANHKELKTVPHTPYLDRALPYDYGLNLTPGTPLYRRLPLRRERKEYEKTLAVGRGAKSSDIAKKLKEQGEELPAYLKQATDAKPRVGFEDLRGESSLVVERMLRGFYLALDKKVDGFSGTFWHTASGYFVPKDHLLVHQPKTEFEGVRLDAPGEARKLPLAWVIGTRARQHKLDDDRVRRLDKIDRFTIVPLTGKRQVVEGRAYYEAAEGFWLRDYDVAVALPPKPPADLEVGEKWVDVDISNETLVASEGARPVYVTIVSTGRHDADPAKDHRTVEGSFRIREKHVSTTMDDDAASDGTYRIEDVPWVMYFEKSFALHGAFWHSAFGREKSHGCVNLTPRDAREIFFWAGPSLPDAWHGVRATKENPGTRVVVHK